jgi:DNA-directed RNA polymerase specialized sigma24 family protein
VTDGDRFPATQHSIVAALGGDDPAAAEKAWDILVRGYWRPVYVYLRHRWNLPHDDAQDVTQEFFGRAHARGFFDRFDAGQARFRTFLRVCLDRFVLREREAVSRLKRGGGSFHLSLDFAGADREYVAALPDPAADPEVLFRREWVRALFAAVVDALRARAEAAGKTVPFELFRLYDLEGSDAPLRPTYEALAHRYGIPVTQVTNHLSAMRRAFRREVLALLKAQTGSEDEYRAEMRELFGESVT